MALDQLLASLTREADAAIADLLRSARTDAAAERAAADALRRKRLDDATAARRRELEARLEEDVVEAGREASRAVLRVREEILDRVLAAARGVLAQRLDDPLVARASEALVAEAATYLGEAGGTVRCHRRLLAALGCVAQRHGLALEEDPAMGAGARLASADGRVVVDATLDGVLLRRWPDEAVRLAARLEAVR